MPARRQFNPGPSTTSGDGAPATAMPPSPGRIGAMPPMQPRGPQTPSAGPRPSPNMGPSTGPSPGMPVVPPPMGNASPGGPTSPMNIGQMLSAQMQPGGAPGGDPAQGAGGPAGLPPWGDNGTRPSAPGRVPVTMGIGGQDPTMMGGPGGMAGDEGAGLPMGDGAANMPTIMMKLLRGMNKI